MRNGQSAGIIALELFQIKYARHAYFMAIEYAAIAYFKRKIHKIMLLNNYLRDDVFSKPGIFGFLKLRLTKG